MIKIPDTPEHEKITHAKPSIYAYWFHGLKEIAREHGWNLVLHGSLSRDMDLILIPWEAEVMDHVALIKIFAQIIGGRFVIQSDDKIKCFPHGRLSYVINVNRGEFNKPTEDSQYYLDISVMPPNRIAKIRKEDKG